MLFFEVEPEHGRLLLGAMRAVALADGDESPHERALLEAVRDSLGLSGEVGSFAPLEPGALEPAALEPSQAGGLSAEERERVVQAMLLMAIIDGKGSREEAAVIEQAAERLGVREARVRNLRQLAEGRVELMHLDLARRGYAREELEKTVREEGLRGLYMTFGPLVGLGHDADVARKYNDLGKLPEGTLGREYWSFIVKNGLGFPGEWKIGERGVWHDMIHVLGGYGVTPSGETDVLAFMAGFRRHDPFFWVFTAVLQFQVGLRLSPFSPGSPSQIDPRRWVRHHRRGAQVACDLSVDWDFRQDYETPVAELRRRFNVVPLEMVPE